MAKQTGLGDNLYVDAFNLSGDVGSIGRVSGGPSPMEVTAIDKSAMERVGGQRDGGMEFQSWFNDAVGQEHLALRGLPTTDRIVSYFRGTGLGLAAASCNGQQINYDFTRGDNAELSLAVEVQSDSFGIEWGNQLTAGIRTDTAATNGTGVDFTTVSTSLGWQAYLHVFSVVGTSVTVTIQDSADNAAFANLAGGAFTAVAGGGSGAQRLQGGSTATVRRFLRAITTGTFSSALFAVVFVRNVTAVTF